MSVLASGWGMLVMFFVGAIVGTVVTAVFRRQKYWDKTVMKEAVFDVLDYWHQNREKKGLDEHDLEMEASLGAFCQLTIETYVKRLAGKIAHK